MGIDLKDFKKHPGMVRWFSPGVLRDAARRVVLSSLFGAYADRRLVHAALNRLDDDELHAQCDYTTRIKPDSDGAVWIDYVADLGDGFDSTYAIAHLIGKASLALGDGLELPRAQALIMGGDEVYPTPGREEYDRRMRTPYRYAFPDSNRETSVHPPLFMIPGNHDWYDGLNLFLAMFCRDRPTRLGSWRACQTRSYFAIRLPDDWWVWGIDTQLGEDIDAPQAHYFVTVAKRMPQDAKVILCTSVPTWVKADIKARNTDEWNKFYRGLNYIALDVLAANCGTARICAVLSGDTHHYSRYSAIDTGTQFVTAGGGGAFLHPTHHLQNTINAKWLGEQQVLSLTTDPANAANETTKEACFPAKDESRRLAFGTLSFTWKNYDYSLFLGIIYAVLSVFLFMWRDDVLVHSREAGLSWACEILRNVALSPMFFTVALLFLAALCLHADHQKKAGKILMGSLHGAVHLAWLLLMVSVLPVVNKALFGIAPYGLGHFLLYNLEVVTLGGFVGGVIWGVYLFLANYMKDRHGNDAFSAMRLDSWKNFLRMRISDDTLTIYPIGLKQVPNREDWAVNENARPGDQNEPRVLPTKDLNPIIIEGPIVIDAAKISRLKGTSTQG